MRQIKRCEVWARWHNKHNPISTVIADGLVYEAPGHLQSAYFHRAANFHTAIPKIFFNGNWLFGPFS